MRVLLIVLLFGLSAWLAKERHDLKTQNAALESSVTELKKKVAELSAPRPQVAPYVAPAPKQKGWLEEKLEEAGKALEQPPRLNNGSSGYRPATPNSRLIR